jgi:aminoglycoside/choline kinase family phosphotransferase
VMGRLKDLDAALTQLARTAPGVEVAEQTAGVDPVERAAQELRVTREGLLALIGRTGEGRPEITRAALHPKDTRNLVCRLALTWPGEGPPSVVIKRYTPDRVAFFSASYRRERGVLELLQRYGAAVPRVYGGELRDDQALLVMQDLGDETLAERLEQSDAKTKLLWLHTAVQARVELQVVAHEHARELAEEVRKIDKERLGAEYYLKALRIALERMASLADSRVSDWEWQRVADQAHHLADFLVSRPAEFIHFELTPHHFLVAERGLHVFDFEQATVGPAEFDVATLLAQPESDVGVEGWQTLVRHYQTLVAEAGLPAMAQLERGVDYAALLKCLVYAGAAVHFLGRFGGEHHLQRFHYYLDQCQSIAARWPPLRPLGALLLPRLRAARNAAPRRVAATPQARSG